MTQTKPLFSRARMAFPLRWNIANVQHTREAVRARSLARQDGEVWSAYAHCDRAPFGWETRA